MPVTGGGWHLILCLVVILGDFLLPRQVEGDSTNPWSKMRGQPEESIVKAHVYAI